MEKINLIWRVTVWPTPCALSGEVVVVICTTGVIFALAEVPMAGKMVHLTIIISNGDRDLFTKVNSLAVFGVRKSGKCHS
jgi:hypothetical protein